MTTTETTTDLEYTPDDIAAAVGVPVGALAIRSDQTELTSPQKRALAFIGLERAPEPAVEAFLHLCQRTGLDPWAKQIYLIERAGKWTPQTGIDGFRIIAERREEFAGTTDILWSGEDGQFADIWLGKGKDPYAARCSALRHDRDAPIVATALFAEFTANNAKWKQSPAWMIGKCAEAGALRRAFPQDFAGLIIDEEAQALTARAARTKVTSARVDTSPVDVNEVTGARKPPAAAEKPAPERAASQRADQRGKGAGSTSAPTTEAPGQAEKPSRKPGTATRQQLGQLGAVFDEAKVTDPEVRKRIARSMSDRADVAGAADLTTREAHQLITDLKDLGPDGIAAMADGPVGRGEQTGPDADGVVDAELVDDGAAERDPVAEEHARLDAEDASGVVEDAPAGDGEQTTLDDTAGGS